jgi:soluble lytic murein transglycosylase
MLNDISRRRFIGGLLSASCVALAPFGTMSAMAGPSGLAVQAVKRALTGDFIGGGDLAQRSGDGAAVKLVELLYLRDHGAQAGYGRIMAFLEAAPKWPLTETLMKRAEQALYENNQDANAALKHFNGKAPVTPYGMLALARANFAAGDTSKGKIWLSAAWKNADLGAELEPRVLSEFGNQLSAVDHRKRMWKLIYAQEASAAIRNAKRLGGEYVQAALVAQMLLRGTSGADNKYAALSGAMKNELALKLVLARFYRRQEKFDKARNILISVDAQATNNADAAAWWAERRIIIRRSVGVRHSNVWDAAYKMSRDHGSVVTDDAVEAEFLAGWIALRFMKKPDLAIGHFAALQKIAPTRTDKARADYWIGRTKLAMGDKSGARVALAKAADNSTVYYGQLARELIGLGNEPEKINGGQASAGAVARVQKDEVMRAMQIMSQAGTKNQLNIFLWSLANRFETADELNAVAAEVQSMAGTSWSLRLAKAASQRGLDIDSWSYPLRGLPSWAQVGKPIEKSMVFALSRQESEFDPNAGSSVGAQGLMQLMPGTAKLVARQYRLPYAPAKLKSDPAYNVKLGAAHLADLVDSFNGSYVLTLVGYNAGPRRSREWVEEFGDPRGGQVDPVDWVECIPFEETRWYVQKVMQNLHVYRSRLAPDTVRPMSADLKRGMPADMAVASTSLIEKTASCKSTLLTSFLGGSCQ